MKIIEQLIQRSEEWLLYRNNGIGSSDISAIMGLNPYKKAKDVYKEKHGFNLKKKLNKYMQRGVDYENEALSCIVQTLGVPLSSYCVEDSEETWIRASLDGYNKEQNLLVEIKIPRDQNFTKQCMFLEDIHFCQVQWQLMITEGDFAYLYVYSPEKKDLFQHVIEKDSEYQKNMKIVARNFWNNNVLMGVEP